MNESTGAALCVRVCVRFARTQRMPPLVNITHISFLDTHTHESRRFEQTAAAQRLTVMTRRRLSENPNKRRRLWLMELNTHTHTHTHTHTTERH